LPSKRDWKPSSAAGAIAVKQRNAARQKAIERCLVMAGPIKMKLKAAWILSTHGGPILSSGNAD
jgi:hypothetical protein